MPLSDGAAIGQGHRHYLGNNLLGYAKYRLVAMWEARRLAVRCIRAFLSPKSSFA